MHPLRELTLDQLRQRTSLKWSEYGPDVLPLWVAEMDVMVAEPIARAMTDAIRSGDVGYSHGIGYAEAYSEFASTRWGWEGIAPARTSLVADVMTGIVELLSLVSEPGDPVVVNPPFFGFIQHAGLADNRVLLEELLTEHLPAVPWQAPSAMFLTWLDCRQFGLGDDPASAFLEQGRGPSPRPCLSQLST